VHDDHWVDVTPGTGGWDHRGRLLTVEVRDDDHCLCVDGERLSPLGLQVRGVIDVSDADVLVLASESAADQQVWSIGTSGKVEDTRRISPDAGVHGATRGGATLVLVSSDLDRPLPVATISSPASTHVVASHATTPSIAPRVTVLPGATDQPRVAVILPREWAPSDAALPVLMDPYGGPHHASVMRHQAAFRESQWLADQGFAVVVVDGRGTPGTPSWERGVHHDFAGPVLEDQVVGLHAAAHAFPQLDLSRVGIRGWSFGGYLAALAVIDRPDIFHAAIAGAPVTDWRLYDTGYTERYLGVPDPSVAASLEPYTRSSLLDRARGLTRPLQLIHGLADDNVFVAHAFQLSQVLTGHGRPHEVLPLSGITHMATQEEVAENLLLLQVDFLRRSLPANR
jgi:dipeptidyl-peptidase-4